MTNSPPKTGFDPDLSPLSEQNQDAAEERSLKYDRAEKVYRNEDGCPMRDVYLYGPTGHRPIALIEAPLVGGPFAFVRVSFAKDDDLIDSCCRILARLGEMVQGILAHLDFKCQAASIDSILRIEISW